MESKLYLKLQTVFSSLGTSRTSTLPSTKENSGASTDVIVSTQTDYMELGDVQVPPHSAETKSMSVNTDRS